MSNDYWDTFFTEVAKDIFIKLHDHRCINDVDKDFMIDSSIDYAYSFTKKLKNFINKKSSSNQPNCSAENNDQIKLTNIPDSCGEHSHSK